jgi:aminomethyltransferase
MSSELKKTPMYSSHMARGGQMVDFVGWSLPVRFKNLREEHIHVREKLGLFDVSHMGEIRVSGPNSLKTLQWVTTNDVSRLSAGQAQYSLFPNYQGGIVDDLIVYCLIPGEDYLLCVNGANIEKDFAYLQDNNQGAQIENQSEQWGQLAIQGPMALAAMEKVLDLSLGDLPSFHFKKFSYQDQTCYVARTGYTGEDGGEVFVPASVANDLWEKFLNEVPQAEPIGLGARDTLRTEMKYPLYGQDIDDSTSPYEAGLGWVVKLEKGDFIGRDLMRAVKDQGVQRKSVGLTLLGPGIARPGCQVFSIDSKQAGVVTSGTLSPSLNKAIAVAILDKEFAEVGTRLLVQVRNKSIEAEVVKTPFYIRA